MATTTPSTPSKSATAAENPVASLSFEDAAAELEDLVEEMENSVLPLERMLASYERGMLLAQQCARRLSDAEKRIELIRQKPDGEISLIPLDENSADPTPSAPPAPERPASRRSQATVPAPEKISPVVNDDEDDDELSLF